MTLHKSSTPLVSIIIPSYNSKHWIGETIDSVLAQTHPNCEVIVIDDGSTDNTRSFLLERYGNQISYHYKENGGLASARNAGLRIAKGNYLQFLDADDLILPEKIESQVEYLNNYPDVDVVYCHTQMFENSKSGIVGEWDRKHLYQNGHVFSGMLKEGYILSHAPLSKRSAIDEVGGFDESIRVTTDWDFWLRVAWSGAIFHYQDGPPLALYRAHQGGISHQGVDLTREGLLVLLKAASYTRNSKGKLDSILRHAQGHWRFRYGQALAENGRRLRGIWQMIRGIWSDPSDLDYKASYLIFTLLVGSRKAHNIQRLLKQIKDTTLSALSFK